MSELAFTGTKTDFYHAGLETATIVRLALALGRPLLVEGEPGCGKTMMSITAMPPISSMPTPAFPNGPSPAPLPEGRRVKVRGCDFYTFRDGLVVRKDSYWKIVA